MKSPITAAQAMSHPAVFETVNSLTECKPHCDFNHPVQKGRATWYCPKCGRDYSLEYLCLYEAMQPSREDKYEPRSFTAGKLHCP